jgi:hypothetical protein
MSLIQYAQGAHGAPHELIVNNNGASAVLLLTVRGTHPTKPCFFDVLNIA